jgi:hypothetical protein
MLGILPFVRLGCRLAGKPGVMADKRPIHGITTSPRGNPAVEKVDYERGLAKLARIVGN